MAGTTRQVRGVGRPGELEDVLRVEQNKLVDDLDFIIAAVNTANGGAINISAASLTAGKVNYAGPG